VNFSLFVWVIQPNEREALPRRIPFTTGNCDDHKIDRKITESIEKCFLFFHNNFFSQRKSGKK
jgi:hypothetical protein